MGLAGDGNDGDLAVVLLAVSETAGGAVMKPINDGGPAYPCEAGFDFQGHRVQSASGGMSLRDYFAAAALTGILARGSDADSRSRDANDAYAWSDAMLVARGKEG